MPSTCRFFPMRLAEVIGRRHRFTAYAEAMDAG